MTTYGPVEELLALRAVEGLDDDQSRELESLLTSTPSVDRDGFDIAAAALDQAMTTAEETLPSRLRERVLAAAQMAGIGETGADAELGDSAAQAGAADVVALERSRKPADTNAWIPWLAAAAAAVLAIIGWWPRVTPPKALETIVEAPAEAEPSAEESPVGPIENAPDRLVRSWSATEDPTATTAGGEVVWSTARQGGFMRISGLAANDPSVEQYQLWIFDRAQDARYPIDGGVFDIPAGAAEVIVRIDAKIAVEEPHLFAVTVEKPGGVVVSSRERIALVAQV